MSILIIKKVIKLLKVYVIEKRMFKRLMFNIS
jgi:hypothetical protein